MAQTLIYLLRHAQSIPAEGVKNRDWLLSEEGQKQAQQLVESLESLKVDVVYSSPYLRALQTLDPYLEKTGQDVIKDDAFAEIKAVEDYMDPISFGDLTKQMVEDVTFCEGGMESISACQVRFMKGLNKVVKENIGKTILVCTHGMPLFSALKYFDTTYGFDFWCRMHMPDIYKLVSDADGGQMDRKFEFELK